MSTYVEYKNEDGSNILIELVEAPGGVVKTSRDGVNVIETGKKLWKLLPISAGQSKTWLTK